MSTLAIVDQLRALPPARLHAVLARLEATLGPEALAALRYELTPEGQQVGFWSRPCQRLPEPAIPWAVCLITGEYGTGKTWMAAQLFLREILAGRSKLPRIICANKPAVHGTVVSGPSGLLRWLPPEVPRVWLPSKGHAGELWIAGVRVACLSADSPGQAIGEGSDLDFRDDVAKWVEECGEDRAAKAWVAASKSCREGLGRAIVPTTPDGVALVQALVRGEKRGIHKIDLGRVEDNRGNLASNFVDLVVNDLREAGEWLPGEGTGSPFATVDFGPLREDAPPRLRVVAVAVDPADSDGKGACEVGIAGGGLDSRDIVHVTHDRSGRLGTDAWPAAAWDLAEELLREHPGAELRFVIEVNRGKASSATLIRGEERLRRALRGDPATSTCVIHEVRSEKNKCERAKAPAQLARNGGMRFARGLTTLETQLKHLTPDGKKSDRADATVHLINDLGGLNEKAAKELAEEAEEAEEARTQADLAARFNAALGGTRRPVPTAGPMPHPDAPPGDARYAGPIARAAPGAYSWRSRGRL